MKAKARAHPMQGLVKYHGLKDGILRIPHHDSVSVNIEALWTETEVEFGDFEADELWINGIKATDVELRRCLAVVDEVRRLAGISEKVRASSRNSLSYAESKGLGFSSSGGAALAASAYWAAGLHHTLGWDLRRISRLARRLAGSSCRSVIGEYARWLAGSDDESSYAVKIGGRSDLDLGILIIPIQSGLRTSTVHLDASSSPFFKERIRSAAKRVEEMQEAIRQGDLVRVGQLTERDTLELHAITMTGSKGIIVYQPESIEVVHLVRQLREEGKPVYFSMQTGPSVFLNTYPEDLAYVKSRFEDLEFNVIESCVGGEVRVTG